MSTASTKKLISAYLDEAEAPLFLSGFFRSPPEAFHNSTTVEIDVQREDEEVAVAIKDVAAGPNHNEVTQWTNKEFTPPVYSEDGPVTALSLYDRMAGQNPFEDVDFNVKATRQAFALARRLEKKIRRAVERMASQVFQTGKLSLTDQNGAVVYEIDYKPKTTHFVTVGTTWAADGATGDPLGDIESIASTIRTDGKREPKRLIMGSTALQRFLKNADVLKRFDNRSMQVGSIAPRPMGMGATLVGTVAIGPYQFEIWTYHATYKDPQTGASTPYVHPEKVIIESGGRLDLTWGGIPTFRRDPQALPFLPARISSGPGLIDLNFNPYITPNGKSLMVEVSARPLTIPVAIDTFGCLDVTA